jgi:DNA-binding MarR family transcriptional regulator
MFFKVLRLQERYVSSSSNDTLSRTEMHVLETIQEMPEATLTDIADQLGVSKATASVSIARLVEKNYLKKVKSPKDKRKSILELTEGGVFCCDKHQKFHDIMVKSLLREFNIAQYPEVLKSLQSLLAFFDALEDREKGKRI